MSTELLARLNAFPRMRSTLDALPPKLLSLATGRPTQVEPMLLETAELQVRVVQVIASIQRATFTGKGDKETVPDMYKEYVEEIVGTLKSTLGRTSAPQPRSPPSKQASESRSR